MDLLGPCVFRTGIVEAAADDWEKIFRKAQRGNRRTHKGHDVDDSQFVVVELQTEVLQYCGYQKYKKEKEEDCAGIAEIERHVRTPQYHIGIRRSGSYAEDKQGTD